MENKQKFKIGDKAKVSYDDVFVKGSEVTITKYYTEMNMYEVKYWTGATTTIMSRCLRKINI